MAAFGAAGEPAIPVDTRKKELVGDFNNGGRELRPKGRPEPHDCVIPEPGNGARVRLRKRELQVLADQLAIAVSVRHLPPGTGKWQWGQGVRG